MAIRDTEWEDCLLEPRTDRELERALREEFGPVPRTAPYFAAVPWYQRVMTRLVHATWTSVTLPQSVIDQIGLMVSLDNSCRYCFGYQRMMMRVMGVPESHIQRVEDELAIGEPDRAQRALLDFARAVSRANPMPGPESRRALADLGVDPLTVREAAASAAFMICFNRAATIPAIPPYTVERLPDSWYGRLLTPWFRYYLSRRIFKSLRPEDVPAVESSGVFACAVEGIRGLPHARALRLSLDEMQAQSALPDRTRALIFAVTSRAVGCPVSEAESVAWCERAGMDRDQVQGALAHLGAPGLDPLEQKVLPFVRETVWPEPVAIQRRARALAAEISSDTLAELIATVSLANTVVRLGCMAPSSA